MTILEAAASAGIVIPTMCFHDGCTNHPSCMICLVKEIERDQLVPSCAMPVADGMNILTNSDEVREARKDALELLLSDHVGDCEAPCRVSCPAFMDIPLMNRLVAAGDFDRALAIVREEIALPLVLGYICPAPCEKACKRKPMDAAVSICLLKRATAVHCEGSCIPTGQADWNGKRIAVIGTGPAGLSAAYYLLLSGYACVLFDAREKAGGMMRYSIPDEVLPKEVLDAEILAIARMGGEFRMNTTISRDYFQEVILPGYDAIILATGHREQDPGTIFGLPPDKTGSFIDRKDLSTGVPGVFACGNIIREQKMAVQSVAHGKAAAIGVIRYIENTGGRLAQQKNKQDAGPSMSEGLKRHSVSVTGHLFEPEWQEYLQESILDHRVEPAGGKSAGFTRGEAMHEAKRCLHCDCRKPVSCKLRMYADEYGAQRRKFAGPDRRRLSRSMQHETVVYETEKCIRCGLCIEIAEQHGEVTGLTFAGRGFDVRITIPFNETIREALQKAAADCVQSCPTGALAFKTAEERNK